MSDEHGSNGTPDAEGAAVHVPQLSEAPPKRAAAWGVPLMKLDAGWTKFEVWLAMTAFALEAFSMTLWVGLKGFSSAPDTPAAVVFRAITGAIVLGTTAHFALAKQKPEVRSRATVAAVFLGMFLAKTWMRLGVDYASNVLNWYQQASFLTLLGGLRGVGTRLTMLLALVGGSLATGRGRHIVIDVLTRFVDHKKRLVMSLVSWVAAAVVCFTAAWGFFDHISIENFAARADDTAGGKIGQVAHQLGEDLFIARKQIGLDLESAPHVLVHAQTYSDWLTGKEWNAWLDASGYAERYGKDETEALKIPDTETRAPIIVLPGRGEPRGELINAAYLVFPIGLIVIGLRFLLRCLLVLSGHVSTEPDESEEWNEHARPGEEPIHAD